MAFASLAHLTRRGDVFYFRRAIPKALLSMFGRHEIKISLQTDHRPTATIRCREMTNAFDRLLGRMDGMAELTPEQTKALLQAYFSHKWAVANEVVRCGRDDPEFDWAFEASASLEQAKALRELASGWQFSNATRAEAHELLEANGHSPKGVGLEEISTLCNGILRAQAEQRRILAAMLESRYSEAKPIDPLFEGVADPMMPPLPGAVGTTAGNTLSDVAEAYRKHLEMEKYPNQTIDEKARVLVWLCDFVGKSRPIKSVSAEEVRDFRDIIRRLPAHFTVRPQFKGKSLRELAALENIKRLSPGTAIKNFSIVRAFFQWAAEDKYVSQDPSAGMNIKAKAGQKLKKKPFTIEQLETFFNSPMYTGCSSPWRSRRWIVRQAEQPGTRPGHCRTS